MAESELTAMPEKQDQSPLAMSMKHFWWTLALFVMFLFFLDYGYGIYKREYDRTTIVALLYLFGFGLFIAVYLLPSVVAWIRGHRQFWMILVLNFLLGWTVLGWIGALVWARTDDVEHPVSAPSSSSSVAPGPS